MHYVYDVECYPNFFSARFTRDEDGAKWCFEISEWKNEAVQLNQFLWQVSHSGGVCVGFNNEHYDYPMIHLIMENNGMVNHQLLYAKSQAIFADETGWGHHIWSNNRFIPQIDLYKIHHFDNKAKMTSLKLLEFNMRMMNIIELPYSPLVPVTRAQADHLLEYNDHDVDATREFFHESKSAIELRRSLSEKFGKDFMNHNDTKIGVEIVGMELAKKGIKLSKYNQTIRTKIVVGEIIFPYIRFERPEFQRVLDFFRGSVMDPDKIKGFFKEDSTYTSATIDGFTFDFGAGGIHGCVSSQIIRSDEDNIIVDIDYASFYPNIAIKNKLYPEHIGPGWYEAMDFMFHERLRVGKKTSEGAAYKLALNGSYGKSNDKHSPFYDPQYTMAITVNGQLILSMLSELLLTRIPNSKMIFINTDGLCIRIPRHYEQYLYDLCKWSDSQTGLELEFQKYKMLAIRDVNSYIGVLDDGGIKRKGAYEYELEWHKNHSAIVVAKAAEAALVHDTNIEQFIRNHTDAFDFFLRTKVPRSAELYHGDTRVQNVTRYYVSTDGQSLTKVMRPTEKQIEKWRTTPHWQHVDTGVIKQAAKPPSGKFVQVSPTTDVPPDRRIGIESGFTVTVCNDIREGISLTNLNYDYYINQARKLVDPLF